MASGPSEAPGLETEADRIHLLVDAVTEYGIYLLDPDGLVVSWNAGAERLQGYKPAEIIGQPYWRLFARDDQQRDVPAQFMAAARDAGHHESEGWCVRKDGTRFWCSATLHKVQDKAGRHIGFAQVVRDITRRKATQDSLLESERRFRILVQGVTDYAIYMIDPSGIITNWNTGAERIKGYTADEIVGHI